MSDLTIHGPPPIIEKTNFYGFAQLENGWMQTGAAVIM